ncbi:uncharacterized protein LOC106393392 [Brassica napus]|uniref:uncharacterized protein LOC106393392 n=1 Tax=Brassica napus TaxID=3708 RepID=UPI002078CD56|nr:uncharacterized protein LOC106393392 [Brassica napus]
MNFLELSSNEHLEGLSFMLYFLSIENAYRKCPIRSSTSNDLMTNRPIHKKKNLPPKHLSHSLRWLCIVCQNPKLESLSSPLSRTHRLRLYCVVFAGQFLHGFHRTNLQYWVTILLTIVAASNISSAPAGVSDSIPVSANDEVLSSAYIKEKTLKNLSKQQLMGPYAMKKVQIQNKEQLELVRVEIHVSSLFNQPSCSLLDNVCRGHEQT